MLSSASRTSGEIKWNDTYTCNFRHDRSWSIDHCDRKVIEVFIAFIRPILTASLAVEQLRTAFESGPSDPDGKGFQTTTYFDQVLSEASSPVAWSGRLKEMALIRLMRVKKDAAQTPERIHDPAIERDLHSYFQQKICESSYLLAESYLLLTTAYGGYETTYEDLDPSELSKGMRGIVNFIQTRRESGRSEVGADKGNCSEHEIGDLPGYASIYKAILDFIYDDDDNDDDDDDEEEEDNDNNDDSRRPGPG